MYKWVYIQALYSQLMVLLLQTLEDFAFDFLSGNGDYLDIANFIDPDNRPDVSTLTKEKIFALVCS